MATSSSPTEPSPKKTPIFSQYFGARPKSNTANESNDNQPDKKPGFVASWFGTTQNKKTNDAESNDEILTRSGVMERLRRSHLPQDTQQKIINLLESLGLGGYGVKKSLALKELLDYFPSNELRKKIKEIFK
jgi:hypothetical protein